MSYDADPLFSSVEIKSSDHVDATINSKPSEGAHITDSPLAGSEIQATGQPPFSTALVDSHDETVKVHMDATSGPLGEGNDLESVDSSVQAAGSQIEGEGTGQSPPYNALEGNPENQPPKADITGSVSICRPDPSFPEYSEGILRPSFTGPELLPDDSLANLRTMFYPKKDKKDKGPPETLWNQPYETGAVAKTGDHGDKDKSYISIIGRQFQKLNRNKYHE